MGYNGLTNLGVEYLARMTAESKPVTFTKIKVGNGSIPSSQTGASTTNLYSFKKEVEILSKSQVENSIKLQVLLNNLDLENGFYVKELGVYIQDGEEEKLYWYINKDNPSFLPDKNTPSTHRYNLFLEVSNLETIIINFTGEGLLADKKFVEDSIEEAFSQFEVGYTETISNLNDEINKKANTNDVNTELNKKLNQGTVPNSLNTAEKIVAALQGNGGLRFDENLLYIEDEGTKKKGFYYLSRLMAGIFECLEETTTTVNDSSKFLDISNKANSDRLNNLSNLDINFTIIAGSDFTTERAEAIACKKIGRIGIVEFVNAKVASQTFFLPSWFRPFFDRSYGSLVTEGTDDVVEVRITKTTIDTYNNGQSTGATGQIIVILE